MDKDTIIKILILAGAGLCVTPHLSSASALLLGAAFALTLGNPLADLTKLLTHQFLALAVVGLGAGMNLAVIGQVGLSGIGYTIAGIAIAFAFGTLFANLFGVERDTALLVTAGTAICGGSAIAAIAPILRAKAHETSVALGTVFMLNAVALILFPWIGHHLNLSESQFGLWSALAIHDTSSVVGATLQYGPHALEVGTTVKLARALWIFPVAGAIGLWRARSQPSPTEAGRAKRPWFILGFILTAALVTWVPELRDAGHLVEMIAKRLMVLTLFLIGLSLTRETVARVGFRPFAQGLVLWIVMATGSLTAIHYEWIHS